MPTTKPGTEHRHLDSRNKWADKTDIASGKPHVHEIDVASFTAADVKQMLTIAGFSGGGTTPIPNPPPPPPPPDVTAPTGTDVSVGQFVSAITGAVTGQTLLVTSGTHDIPGATYLAASGVTVVAKALRPVIKPVGRPNGLFVKGSRVVVRGLDFASSPGKPEYNDENGSALLEILGVDAPVLDTLLEDIGMDLPIVAGSRQQGLYLAGDIERLTARNFRLNGHASQGGRAQALTAWHEAGPAPLRDIVFEDWTFTDFFNPVVFWLPCTSLTFRRCRSVGTLNVDMQLDTRGPVYFEDCSFPKPILLHGAGGTGTRIVNVRGNTGPAFA
jgi:hypothetical protein